MCYIILFLCICGDEKSKTSDEEHLKSIDKRLTALEANIKENTALLNNLPKTYVPRFEHDLRDHKLDVAARLNRVEDELDNNKKGGLIFLFLVFAAGFGMGAAASTSYWIRKSRNNRDIPNPY